jgi:hypothetical protein
MSQIPPSRILLCKLQRLFTKCPVTFTASFAKFFIQTLRSTKPNPTIELVYCVHGPAIPDDLLIKLDLQLYDPFPYKTGTLVGDNTGTKMVAKGYVLVPCVLHLNGSHEDGPCEECSPDAVELNWGMRRIIRGEHMSQSEWIKEWIV